MAKDILYQPNLEYKKSYYTEGEINNDSESQSSSGGPKTINRTQEFNDLIAKIKSNFDLMPPNITEVFLPPFIGTAAVIAEIPDKYKTKEVDIPTIDPQVVNIPQTDDNNDDDDGLYDFFGKSNDIYVDLTTKEVNIEEELNRQYYEDLMEVVKDYFLKLNNSLEKYIYNALLSFAEITNKDDKLLKNLETKDIKNQDVHHLTDFITKSQITLDQKLLLSKKFFDIDETIVQLRSCRLANEQRIRYNKINEQRGVTNLESKSNQVLKESKVVSEKKYEENFYGLYKYLNSSVILLNESTNSLTKQNYAKAMINEKERIKL